MIKIAVSHIENAPKNDEIYYTITAAASGMKYKSKDPGFSNIKTGDILQIDYQDFKFGTTTYHNITTWKKIGNGKPPVQPKLTPPLPAPAQHRIHRQVPHASPPV